MLEFGCYRNFTVKILRRMKSFDNVKKSFISLS